MDPGDCAETELERDPGVVLLPADLELDTVSVKIGGGSCGGWGSCGRGSKMSPDSGLL